MEDDLFLDQDRAARTRQADEAAFTRAFPSRVHRTEDGVRIHYLSGGEGPAVVLLHGFPQHSHEWRLIMPQLAAAGFSVIAPDLRGFGRSDRPAAGFATPIVAEDIRQIVRQLGLGRVDLVGHDAGASVAYAWAATYPDEVRRLVLMEAFPAGLEPAASGPPELRGKATWHLAFLSTPDLPEAMLAGRERLLLAHLLRHGAFEQTAFPDAEIDAYTTPFAEPGGVRGAAAHIRAIPESAAAHRRLAAHKLPMPVLAIGGEISFGARMEEAARGYAERVSGAVAPCCGHWIPEERPVWLAERLIAFLKADEAELARAA